MLYNNRTDSATVISVKKPKIPWCSIMGKDDEKGKEGESSVRCLKFAQKAIYVVVLFILTLFLLANIYSCLKHYWEAPTYVATKVAPQHKALFPAMTICPQNNGYNEENLKVF
jgi:hypothetical protein